MQAWPLGIGEALERLAADGTLRETEQRERGILGERDCQTRDTIIRDLVVVEAQFGQARVCLERLSDCQTPTVADAVESQREDLQMTRRHPQRRSQGLSALVADAAAHEIQPLDRLVAMQHGGQFLRTVGANGVILERQ